MKQEDSQEKPQKDTSETKSRLMHRAPAEFKRPLSDEQFEKLADRTTERMIKSLHEAKPD
jgi:hypothetical protein